MARLRKSFFDSMDVRPDSLLSRNLSTPVCFQTLFLRLNRRAFRSIEKTCTELDAHEKLAVGNGCGSFAGISFPEDWYRLAGLAGTGLVDHSWIEPKYRRKSLPNRLLRRSGALSPLALLAALDSPAFESGFGMAGGIGGSRIV